LSLTNPRCHGNGNLEILTKLAITRLIQEICPRFLHQPTDQQTNILTNEMTDRNISRPRKPPVWCKNRRNVSCISQIIANFLLKFLNSRYHGNGGWSETNFTTTVKLGDPENPLLGEGMGVVSPI